MTDAAAAAPSGTPGGKAYYVTTPIYYVSAAPHIGNAYTTVAGDVLTRWHRQRGEDVWYLTGTDEHGEKVSGPPRRRARRPRSSPTTLVENAWKPVLQTIDAANDDFIRTTEPRHTRRVQEFWATLNDKGDVYQGSYEGPYCVPCEEFKLESELIDGTGDLAGQKLCPIHGAPGRVPRPSRTTSSGCRSLTPTRLLEPLRDAPGVRPAGQCPQRGRVLRPAAAPGPLDLARHTFNWGIPIPWDDKHVLYVWIDALLNYLSARRVRRRGRRPRSSRTPGRRTCTWSARTSCVFHAVIWPAMLLASRRTAAEDGVRARVAARRAGENR